MSANCSLIKVDNIDDCEAEFGVNGWSVTRKFTVTGVQGASALDKLINAVNADDGVTTVPAVGTPITTGSLILLRSVKPKAITPNTFELILTYASYTLRTSTKHVDEVPFQPIRTSVRISASVGQTSTSKDRNGNEIKVTYTYPAVYVNEKLVTAAKEVTQVGTVSLMVPQKVITLSKRIQTGISELDELWESFGGCVNSVLWRNGAARTWMFSGMEATPNENNTEWDVQCQLQYRKDTWDETVVFIDPNTGHVPGDVEVNQDAEKLIQLYKEADFHEITLI